MKRSEILFGILRVPLDGIAVFLAVMLSYVLRASQVDLIPGVQLLEPAATLPSFEWYLTHFALQSVIGFILIASLLRLYALQNTSGAWNEMGKIALTATLWLVAVIAWYFLVKKQLFYSRILLLQGTFFTILFVSLGRAFITLLQRALLRKGYGVRSVVSIGRQKPSDSASLTLKRDARYAYLGHVKNFDALMKLEATRPLDLVLQTDPNPDSQDTLQLIDHCRSQHIGYAFLPPVFADVPHLLNVDRLGLLPMIRFQPTPLDGWGRVWKRAFDILVSLLAIIILFIPMVIVALVILLESGWPLFYVSRRVGEGGKENLVPVLKFRSMVKDADARKADLAALNHRKDGPLFKVKNDPRVTRIGALLRRFSIDEWPQLLNVLVGHLSLVGPRPHLPEEVKRYTNYQRRVFAVKPGVTGLAQISGRSDLTFDDEVALDLKYIEEWSLLFDIWIMWRTVVVVLGRRGAD